MSPAKNMPALPFFFDAYLVDTIHLKTAEHGAYFLLLGHAWKQGGYLPDDDERLAAMTFLTPDEWASIKARVMAFWTLSKRGWSQKRLLKELRYVADVSKKRQEAGKKGGEAKSRNSNEKPASKARILPEQKDSKAVAPTPTPTLVGKPTEDAALFERASQVLGKGSGGLVAKLKQAKVGSVAEARAVIELASTKHDPRGYVGGVIAKAADQAGDPIRGSVGAI